MPDGAVPCSSGFCCAPGRWRRLDKLRPGHARLPAPGLPVLRPFGRPGAPGCHASGRRARHSGAPMAGTQKPPTGPVVARVGRGALHAVRAGASAGLPAPAAGLAARSLGAHGHPAAADSRRVRADDPERVAAAAPPPGCPSRRPGPLAAPDTQLSESLTALSTDPLPAADVGSEEADHVWSRRDHGEDHREPCCNRAFISSPVYPTVLRWMISY